MKKIFVLILLSFFICNTLMAEPITDREQATIDAKRDAQSKTLKNVFIGTSLGCASAMLFYSTLIAEEFIFSGKIPPRTDGEIASVAFVITSIGSGTFLMTADVPVTKLIGKSPEYVSAYTKTYRRHIRLTRGIPAVFGCCAGGFIMHYIIDSSGILGQSLPE